MTEKHTPGTTVWPKTYLLQVYSRALSEGCIRIELKDKGQFVSFSQAFYRLRRRSDAQHAAFILPEYHLIFCTWEPERGTCLVTYDALPDGVELPKIISVDPSERTPAPKRREVGPAMEPETEKPFNAEEFLASIVEEAGKKVVDDSDDLG